MLFIIFCGPTLLDVYIVLFFSFAFLSLTVINDSWSRLLFVLKLNPNISVLSSRTFFLRLLMRCLCSLHFIMIVIVMIILLAA